MIPSTSLPDEQQDRNFICYLKRKLQSTIKDAVTPLWRTESPHSYPKCALVSNSGAQLQHLWGKRIDSADAVFRFNDAPVEGYEDHVGSRETVRVGNQMAAKALEKK